ncbi:MAG: ABC transporter permease, partial [Gammaproteobacteria bacterium]|nr:ABC transporter permease [Gammaproteobacteria bacterium]
MFAFIAWRNLWRNKIRSILTISALGGGLALLILYSALLNGMVKQMADFSTKISSGHIQVHLQAFVDDQDLYATIPWALINKLENDSTDIKISPRLYGAGLASVGDISSGVMLRAVDPEKEKQVTTMLSHIRQGTADLSKYDSANGLDRFNVIVGAQFSKNMNISPGDELVLITQASDGSIGNGLFIVSGILKPIEPTFDRSGILLSIEAYNSLMYLESGAHELAIRADNHDLFTLKNDLSARLSLLQKTYPTDELSGPIIVRTWKELVPAVSDMIEVSTAAIYILGMIMLGLASMGMMNTMLMAVFERKHEFGILLSLG